MSKQERFEKLVKAECQAFYAYAESGDKPEWYRNELKKQHQKIRAEVEQLAAELGII